MIENHRSKMFVNVADERYIERTIYLLFGEGDAWPSMGIYSASRSSYKVTKGDKDKSEDKRK